MISKAKAAKSAEKAAKLKYDTLGHLLGQYGMSNIDGNTFWAQMKQHGWGQQDIDQWCATYYQLEQEREDEREKAARTARTATARYEGSTRGEEQGVDRQVQGQGGRQGWQGDQHQDGEARGSGSVIVTLSEKWIAKAIEVGKARNNYAIEHGQQNYGELYGDKLEHDITGAIGECAVAKHFQIKWQAKAGVRTSIDVNERVEVRSRGHKQAGRDLVIRPDDKDDYPYVLTWVRADYSVEIVGWLYGKEGKGKGSGARTWASGLCRRRIGHSASLLSY